MTLLAIETSCDETSAAVLRHGRVLSNIVSSQIKLHTEYGGVVPELATREHLRNLPGVVRLALSQASVSNTDIQAVAVTQGPGLPNALMTGIKFAQGFALARRLPLVGVHHHEAHLYSPWMTGNPPQVALDQLQPNVSLIVSGGHTLLVHVQAPLQHQVLGGTLDDAAGECFDKSAKLMGLPYPGGPEMDRLAQHGNPEAYPFPRSMMGDSDDFSFSGLKTAVRYFIQKQPELIQNPQSLADLCASVQAAIVDVLVRKLMRAAGRSGVRLVTASGGVTCNRQLRKQLQVECEACGLGLKLAEANLCTDNAAMIGLVAHWKLQLAPFPLSVPELEPMPSWSLGLPSS